MSQDITVYKTCQHCGGDGIYSRDPLNGDPINIECPWPGCNGTGMYAIGTITLDPGLNDIYTEVSTPTNIFPAYIVLENIETTEYNALTDNQKDGVNLLLSCGFVDLNTGKAGRVRLWNWFGEESDTVANLTALLA